MYVRRQLTRTTKHVVLMVLVASAIPAIIGVTILAVALVASAGGSRRAALNAQPSVERRAQVESLASIDPAYKGLTPDQKLDKASSSPDFHGYIRGTTGQPVVKKVPAVAAPVEEIVTDFPFTVRGFVGPGKSPYSVGATIGLRVPGGTISKERMDVEDAPTVAAGQDLYVLVRDQGRLLGGNTGNMLIASDRDDVFVVQNGAVHGQGAFAQLVEPVATFERHFAHPGATPTPGH